MVSSNQSGKHAQGDQGGNRAQGTQANGNKESFVSDKAVTQAIPLADEPTEMLKPVGALKPIGAKGKAESQQATVALHAIEDSQSIRPPDDDAFAGFDVGVSGYPIGNEPVNPNSYKAADIADLPQKKRHRSLKAFIITFLVLACVLGGIYVGVAMMFKSQFLPNTYIGDFDISMKTNEEVVAMLDSIPEDYRVDVLGGNFKVRATGADVGMKIDSEGIVQAMHEDQNIWYWPWYILEPAHDLSFMLETTYDKKACNKIVGDAVEAYNKNAQAPKNAYIQFDENEKKFVIVPEEIGTQLNSKKVQKEARKAVMKMKPKATLTEKQLLQPDIKSDNEKLVSTVDTANGLLSAHVKLRINGNVVDEIGSEQLSQYISISDNYDVALNEEGLAGWVNGLAASYDTIGMERNYTRADGKAIWVSGGSYGWQVDQESLRTQVMEAIKAGGESDIEIPCIDSANVYAGRGERDWGNRYVDVDVSEQHVRFYGDDGSIIWEADCITGAPDEGHATPQGVWYVIAKESPSTLIGYTPSGKKEYETEVEYWMPFEGNAVGFHDATWQPGFGGSMYAEGYGSHGCVNLSYSDAESLYGIIQPNDVVVVHS